MKRKNMKKKKKKVIGYIRVSSQQQVEDKESLERQAEKIRAYCALKGITGLEIISDEGISGYKTSTRKGYQTLLKLCKAGQVKTLIVYDLSRLSRSLKETLTFFDDVIKKQKIEFVSLCNDIDTTTSTGILFFQLLGVFNEFYRNDIATKTKNALGHKKNKQEKTGGTLPYGYVLGLKGKLFELPEEQEVIKLIFDFKQAGLSYRAIARELEERGIKTKTGGSKWYGNTIKDILSFKENFDLHTTKKQCKVA